MQWPQPVRLPLPPALQRVSRKAGFTLIEVVIVIAVIGILAAIAIPIYGEYREKAKKAQAYAQLKDFQRAVEVLAADTERWPGPNPAAIVSDTEVWDLNAPAAGLVATNGAFPNWNGPYLTAVPKDPWGSDYFFDPDYEINGQDFAVVGSFGPNKAGKNLYDADDVILKLPTR